MFVVLWMKPTKYVHNWSVHRPWLTVVVSLWAFACGCTESFASGCTGSLRLWLHGVALPNSSAIRKARRGDNTYEGTRLVAGRYREAGRNRSPTGITHAIVVLLNRLVAGGYREAKIMLSFSVSFQSTLAIWLPPRYSVRRPLLSFVSISVRVYRWSAASNFKNKYISKFRVTPRATCMGFQIFGWGFKR